MANEFKHKDPCSTLTQAEYIAACGDGHIFACQATGDILYASSATVLKNLARGNANEILSTGGSNIPAWTASPSVTDLTISGGCITLTGAATDIDLIDNNASALSFDASGKAGIIDIVTTDCSEGVTMSGTLGVTGVLTATGGLAGGAICIGSSTITTTGLISGGSLDIDSVLINGTTIGHTCDTDLITVGDQSVTIAGDLAISGGCITLTGAATDVDLIDNNACALSFDASGQAGILAIDTQNCAEGVKMAGKLGVTGVLTATGGIELSHATANTLTASSGVLSIEGNAVYSAGGTDVALADGGTGASLSDPGADRILFWDDGAGAVAFLTASTNLTICGTNITAAGAAQIATGSYTGDGEVSLAVTAGLSGQQIKMVQITQRGTSAAGIADRDIMWTTDVIVDDNAAGLAYNETTGAGNMETRTSAIIALGCNSFTVDDNGVDSDPNACGVVYNFIVWGGG